MMAMSGSGGFLVHATKMQVGFCALLFTLSLTTSSYDDPTAEAALMQRRQKNKKPKPDIEAITNGFSTESKPSSEEPKMKSEDVEMTGDNTS